MRAGLAFGMAVIVGLLAHSSAIALAADSKAPRIVPDADWVAFIDVEGLMNSSLVKFLMENGGDMGFEINDLAEVKEQFGVDPLTDIRDISISGSGDPEQGQFVAIAQTTPAIDDLLAQLTGAGGGGDAGVNGDDGEVAAEGMPDIEALQIDGQQVYIASDGDVKTYFHVRQGPTSNDRLVVVSMDKDWMARGLKVAGGKANAVDSKVKPAAGAFLFAAVTKLDWLDISENDQPASAIAKNARGLVVNFGEQGEDTFFDLRVATANPEDAQNISDIAQGLLALGRLAAQHEPDMQPLLAPMRSLSLKSDGAAVSLNFKHNTQGLIDLLNAAAESGAFGDTGDGDEYEDEDEGQVEVGVRVGGEKQKEKDKAGD